MLQSVGGANVDTEAAKGAEHVVDLEIREDPFSVCGAFFGHQGHAARRAGFDAGVAGDAFVVAIFFVRDERDGSFETLHRNTLFGVNHGHGFLEPPREPWVWAEPPPRGSVSEEFFFAGKAPTDP